jgi:glycosyltransferase 2 family protein
VKILSKLSLLLKITVMMLTVFIIYKIVDIKVLFIYIKKTSVYIITLAVLISVFKTWLTAMRWKLLNKGSHHRLSDWDYFRYTMISNSFNIIMPGALGGDIIKASFLVKETNKDRLKNLVVIFIDRLLGLTSIVLLATFCVFFSKDTHNQYFFIKVLLVVYFFMFLFIILMLRKETYFFIAYLLRYFGKFGEKLNSIVTRLHGFILEFKHKKQILIKSLAICIPIHLSYFIMSFIIAKNIGLEIAFGDLVVVTSIVWLITSIPISISGIGVRELSFVYLLSLYNIKPEVSTSLSLIIFFITVLLAIIGIPFILIKKTSKLV